jgi:hypothetical protein
MRLPLAQGPLDPLLSQPYSISRRAGPGRLTANGFPNGKQDGKNLRLLLDIWSWLHIAFPIF